MTRLSALNSSNPLISIGLYCKSFYNISVLAGGPNGPCGPFQYYRSLRFSRTREGPTTSEEALEAQVVPQLAPVSVHAARFAERPTTAISQTIVLWLALSTMCCGAAVAKMRTHTRTHAHPNNINNNNNGGRSRLSLFQSSPCVCATWNANSNNNSISISTAPVQPPRHTTAYYIQFSFRFFFFCSFTRALDFLLFFFFFAPLAHILAAQFLFSVFLASQLT